MTVYQYEATYSDGSTDTAWGKHTPEKYLDSIDVENIKIKRERPEWKHCYAAMRQHFIDLENYTEEDLNSLLSSYSLFKDHIQAENSVKAKSLVDTAYDNGDVTQDQRDYIKGLIDKWME